MAYTPTISGETLPQTDGSPLLSRYLAFGPSGTIPTGVMSELITDAGGYQTPQIATAAGWIALERAAALSYRHPGRKVAGLRQAEEYMTSGLEHESQSQATESFPDEPYRRQLAYLHLPLYGKLIRNETLSKTELDENQTWLALLASEIAAATEGYQNMGQTYEASQMDGLVSELILQMGYNRAPITGPEGVIGFVIGSTFRQDTTPFARNAESHRNRSQLKSNWDLSIMARKAKPTSTLGAALGKLGHTPAQETGLQIGDKWRVAAKLQVKAKLILEQRRGEGSNSPRSTQQSGDTWDADDVVFLQPDRTQSLAAEYDFAKVTPIGMAEDFGLRTPEARLEILKLLVAEGVGNKLSSKDQRQLVALSKTIKRGVMAKLDTSHDNGLRMSA